MSRSRWVGSRMQGVRWGLFVCAVVGGAGLLLANWKPTHAAEPASDVTSRLFARDNLIAWCIVPFDSKKRKPEERAAMLEKLGFKHFAYDWRADDIPTFDAEIRPSRSMASRSTPSGRPPAS